MSNTREDQFSKSIEKIEVKQTSKFYDGSVQAAVTGTLVGACNAAIMHPMDRLGFYLQTVDNISCKKAVISTGKHFMRGFCMTLANSVTKNSIFYLTKDFVSAALTLNNPNCSFNEPLGGFIGGLISVYATNYISVAKALRIGNTETSEILSMNSLELYKRGLHATAGRDSVSGLFYFGSRAVMPSLASKLGLQDYLPVGSMNFVIDTLAGVIAGYASNPLAMIVINQKAHGGTAIEQATKLYKQGGLPRFYQGAKCTIFVRMAVQGLVAGTVIRGVEENYKRRLARE